jgi:hypothetical protein
LVVIPLANVRLERPWAPLGPRAAIQRAADAHLLEEGADLEAIEREDLQAGSELRDHLGDSLAPATQAMLVDGARPDALRALGSVARSMGRDARADFDDAAFEELFA